jgi:mannose-6-phosphate isomerase-like protein (cupin superfamily)
MTSPILAPPLAGRAIGAPDGAFAIAEWRDPGGPAGPPRLIAPPHLHHRDDEAWYVLDGVLCVRNGDETVEARAGSSVFVPRGRVHTYWNPGVEPTRYLLIMTANIYRLIQAIHAATERTPEAMRALFERYDSELAG